VVVVVVVVGVVMVVVVVVEMMCVGDLVCVCVCVCVCLKQSTLSNSLFTICAQEAQHAVGTCVRAVINGAVGVGQRNAQVVQKAHQSRAHVFFWKNSKMPPKKYKMGAEGKVPPTHSDDTE